MEDQYALERLSNLLFFLYMHLNAVLNKFLWTLNRHSDIGEAVTDLHAGF